MKKLFIFFLWFVSIIFTIIWTFENPEKIEKIKSEFKKNKKVESKIVTVKNKKISANSFTVNLSQVLENTSKTALLQKNLQKFF